MTTSAVFVAREHRCATCRPSGCWALTVRHFDEPTLARLTAGREVLVEQRSRTTARFVLK